MKIQPISIVARAALVSFLLISIAALNGCGSSSAAGKNTGSSAPSLRSIEISAASSSVTVGQTVQLSASGTYSDKSTKDLTSSVTWSATPASAVTISASGVLTANASGKVTVAATLDSISASLTLNIAPKLVSIAITPPGISIAPATKQQFTATGTYSDNSTQDITSIVTWSSSNTNFATISTTPPTSGLALAVGPGTTTITATSGSISATASLTVTSAYPTLLVVSPNPATMALFVSQQFTATATFSDSSTQDVSNAATWSSSSTQNATVTATGLVTAKQVTNSVTISASFTGLAHTVSANSALTINASNLTSISITPPGPIAQDTKVQFTATGAFNDGSTHNLTSQVAWSSSNKSVLNFTSTSTAQGLASSTSPVTVTATLTSQSGTVTGTLPFTVTDATIQSIAVTPASPSIAIAGHVNFTATGSFLDSSGNSSTQDITISSQWNSSASTVASVTSSGSSYGSATGLAQGNTTISATFNSVVGSQPLTVTGQTLQSIAVDPNPSYLALGSTTQLTAVGTFSDGTNTTTQPISQGVTWSETDTSGSNVAMVNAAGVVTGNSPGTANIVAKYTFPGGASISGSDSVLVEPSPLLCVEITPPGVSAAANSCSQFTPPTVSLPENIQLSFAAWAIFQGQTVNLTSSANWTSSTSAVATIGNGSASGGIATGVAPGSATISANFADDTGTATLNVTNAALASIDISPSSASISLGNSQKFSAIGNFVQGSTTTTVDITTQVTWASTNSSVAVVKSNGTAVSAARGSTGITASLDGVTSSPANLTVF